MTTPSFYAIIPAHVRYCKTLEANAKLFYGELTALSSQEGYCWASNKYFADLYGTDERTVKRWIHSLKENKFITVEITIDGIQRSRKIWISPEFQKVFTKGQKCPDVGTKMSPRGDKNVPCINTSSITPSKSHYVPSADAAGLADLLLEKVKETKPDIRPPNLNKWAKEIEGMIKKDNRDPEKIKIVLKWLPKSNFWAKNILSAEKLRLQFDRLELEMADPKHGVAVIDSMEDRIKFRDQTKMGYSWAIRAGQIYVTDEYMEFSVRNNLPERVYIIDEGYIEACSNYLRKIK